METADPSVIESVAIHRKDVVRAHEMQVRKQTPAVLRITPPFSERMRGRLHIADNDQYDSGMEGAPIHLSPATLLADPPALPLPDETADQLRADSDRTYSPEEHYEFHAEQVAEWRARIADIIVSEVSVQTTHGNHTLTVVPLGSWPPAESTESER